MKIKREVMNMHILPSLSNMERNGQTRVARQRKMQRKILGFSLKDRISNKEIKKKTGLQDAVNRAWTRHASRSPTGSQLGIGKRNQERQMTRLSDELRIIFGSR